MEIKNLTPKEVSVIESALVNYHTICDEDDIDVVGKMLETFQDVREPMPINSKKIWDVFKYRLISREEYGLLRKASIIHEQNAQWFSSAAYDTGFAVLNLQHEIEILRKQLAEKGI